MEGQRRNALEFRDNLWSRSVFYPRGTIHRAVEADDQVSPDKFQFLNDLESKTCEETEPTFSLTSCFLRNSNFLQYH